MSNATSGFCFPDMGSSSIPNFVDQFSDSWYGSRGNIGILSDELGGLARDFGMMNIGNRFNSSDVGRLGRGEDGFRINDYSNAANIRPSNGQNFGFSDGSVDGYSGNGGYLAPYYRDERNVEDEIGFRLGQRGDNVCDSFESSLPYHGLGSRNCSIDFPFDQTSLRRAGSYGYKCNEDEMLMNTSNYDHLSSKVPVSRVSERMPNGGLFERGDARYGTHLVPSQQNLSMYMPPYSNEVNYFGNMGVLNTMDSSQLIHYRQALSRETKLYNSMRENAIVAEEMKKGRHLDTNGKNFQLNNGVKSSLAGTTVQKLGERVLELSGQLMSCDPVILQSLYDSMGEVQSNIYFMAKDQNGCRFLQKKFDKGSFDDVQLIFNEIIDHMVELMINPFGNYLIQKLLDVCNEEQRLRIVHAVTRDRGQIVMICLNTHGTRVIQKLIESLKTKKQISLIVQALEPGFLDLIRDLNGNHVVQRCLQCLSSEDNKFIFDAAAKFCVEIASHKHGCCVLQRCIAHSSGEYQKRLVEGICANGLRLAQDPFGNYVIQYIIELKIRAAATQLTSQFEGHYIHLAAQKFSSHVVERCLKFIEDSRARIVYELLSVSDFEQLLQDPFANYVIKSALEFTKGPVNELLVAALRPHSTLRTNPYCKKIFTGRMLKK